MKPLIIFLMVICYSSDITAQRVAPAQNNFPQHNTFQQVSTITAYEQSISDDFLFLVDDDIQRVIFNPARASTLSNSFISTSIKTGSNTNFTSAGLVPVKSGQWFYSVGGVVNSLNRSEDLTDVVENQGSSESGAFIHNDYSNRIRTSNTEYNHTNEQAEFRLLKIFGDNNSVAMGIFGGYSQNRYQRISESEEVRNRVQEIFEEDTLVHGRTEHDVYLDERYQNENQKQFTLGFEYYKWRNGNDRKHRLYVQNNIYTSSANQTNLETREDEVVDRRVPEVRNQSSNNNHQNH
ncbi:MAG: hypothetical protein WD059_10045 [Balneolaceae bacterium]